MFHHRVLRTSVIAFLLLILSANSSSDSAHHQYPTPEAFTPIDTDQPSNSVLQVHQQPTQPSNQHFPDSHHFVFRKQTFKESMENIQTVENGMLRKSTYIPIISAHWNQSHSDEKSTSEDGSIILKKESENRSDPTAKVGKAGKEEVVVKNGKKYRIVKVKKSGAGKMDNDFGGETRRSLKLLPNLSSILPLKWMTRENKNESYSEKRTKNATGWSKWASFESPGENSKEIVNQGVHNSEKIRKLLNLFSIVKFENGECYANGMKGTCLHQLECEAKGGKFAATCADQLGVCCYSEKTCGETSNDSCTYFINEGYPDSSSAAPKVCTLVMEKASPQVKQLRLDLQIFQLREPVNGTCLHDRLVVSGHDLNNVVPDICGGNTGQHMYVDVEDSDGPFNLNIITMGEYFPRNFRIKVSQIERDNPALAPKNCLQYYTEPTGYIQSFNYQQENDENLDEVLNGYFPAELARKITTFTTPINCNYFPLQNNLNYAICFKKLRDFCSISYTNEEVESRWPTFQLINVDEDGERLLPPSQAGAETFDCPDDYIIVNGIRLCGERLNDASVEVDYTKNYPVTDTSNGPFVLSVRTDAAVSGRGFKLKYSQNPCLV